MKPNKDLLLQQIPLFSNLSKEEADLIKQRVAIVEYKKNQVIYEENSPRDAFYCVVFGRVMLYTHDQHGRDTVLEYLHRGKYFGIISLLTGDHHSVTAQAVNDSSLLVIKQSDFDFILKKIPRLAIDLSQTLSRRLKTKAIHQKIIFESTIISAFSSYSRSGKSIYTINLALSLHKETNKSVIVLDICSDGSLHSLSQKLGVSGSHKIINLSDIDINTPGIMKDFIAKSDFGIDLVNIAYQSQEDALIKKILGILSFLINDYHYIILDLPSSVDKFILSILNQSDLIHILTSAQTVDLKKTHKLIDRLKKNFGFQESKIKIFINEYKLSNITCQEQSDFLGYKIHATLPKIDLYASDRLVLDAPESEYSKIVRRISRQLGDNLVGLALGVGAGYGFCHIGVLKVIEEENIPIDVISGSSIGALIASFWAVGMRSEEILEIIKEEFKQPKYTWSIIDLTFPSLGFIKGKKLYKFLKKYLGNKTFCDVKLPLKIMASNIKRKETRALDKGLLVDAVMASCSMPGVFRPFKFNEETLLDGGVISPLPTEVLFKMGVKKIIAVNVTPSREDILRQHEKIKAEIAANRSGPNQNRWFSIKRYFQNKFKDNILDIIFSSIEVMQSEIIQKEGQLADVVLHPDIGGLHWLELFRAKEFVKRGEDEARRNLDKIWQLINE